MLQETAITRTKNFQVSSEEDSESHGEEGGSSEEDGLTRNKGSGGPDMKERASHANKSSSDEEEMPEEKDIQARQGLPNKLLSLFKGCTSFSLPYHLDCRINAVSDGWISFEEGGIKQTDDLNGFLGRRKKS